jgi:competence protein ComEC
VHYVAVHEQPSGQSSEIGKLRPGEKAEVLASVSRWYQVQLSDTTVGYLYKSAVVEVASTETPISESETPTAPAAIFTPTATSAAVSATATPGAGAISFNRISSPAQIPHTPPAAGAYRIHLIDVGTGLSVLIQGNDFNFLYDGGSNDDEAGISNGKDENRLVAYLFAALGPSGPAECVPDGDAPPAQADNPKIPIQQVVLSHPHNDHGVLLADVLHCYDVANVWNTGTTNDTGFYHAFLEAVAGDAGLTYHTATAIPGGRTVTMSKSGDVSIPASVTWTNFTEGNQQALGANAKFTVLHVDPTEVTSSFGSVDYNFNSIVLRVDLGGRSVLLTGDTTNGKREPHTTPPTGAEADLIAHHAQDIHVDILQVGHHGSDTSTRAAFLAAVAPQLALIGCGPMKYSSVVLPDADVVSALGAAGATVLRTDVSDQGGCAVADRVGRDDAKPGGCDNWVIDIGP